MSEGRCCPSTTKTENSGCHSHEDHHHEKAKRDYILILSTIILATTLAASFGMDFVHITQPHYLHHFTHAALGILGSMWWGVALGIVIIGIMGKIPRDFFTALMGRSDNMGGLWRAVFGGLLLDLCCHGILLVAAKLYERGVSLAQVVTFLVASPWNSVSLTLVLIGLIGLQWTLLYILGSVVIAITAGFILQKLTKAGILPDNPNASDINPDFKAKAEFISLIKSTKITRSGMIDILKSGWNDGKMIIKWLLFGTIIAASLRTFVPADIFGEWLGPTGFGLFMTLVIATIVEICSEGSAPIAGEIVTNANAPGNGFAFLMAGVATDYTEIMAVREFTKSWTIALAIPLITVPQVVLIGWLMNVAAS